MAYFSALGGTGGTSATITVTYSEDFYGLTITATNGTTTLTKTATSSGTLVFDVSEGGTWTVSGTVEGATYSESVDVFFEYTVPPLVALPDGSTALPVNDIQMWLKCAGIRDKTTYTTLSDVLGDTETLIALCADSNACDYMARSTTWASGVAADSTAMLIVGKYNYCANALLSDSTWASAICNSTYASSVVSALVPIMTSNTTPSGECFGSSSYSSGYPYYYAFDNSSSTSWASSVADAVGSYLGYDFGTDVHIGAIKIIGKGTKNNPTNITVQGYDTEWHDISTFDVNTSTIIYGISNTSTYTKCRVKVNSFDGTQGTNNVGVQTLQFYGRTDNANYIPLVPKMTSNTTPSGVAFSSGAGDGFPEYGAFDRVGVSTGWNNGHQWNSNSPATSQGNVYLGYEFPSSVTISKVGIWPIYQTVLRLKDFAIAVSDDGTNYDIVLTGTMSSNTSQNDMTIFDIPTPKSGKYVKLIGYNTYSDSYKNIGINELQFYRKSDLPIIHSAVEDNIFYMDDGSPVALCGIPVGDTIDVDMESFKGQTLTLVSTVAKDPTNLSNDFSMNVRITPNITEIYLMPLGAVYWYGHTSQTLGKTAWVGSGAGNDFTYNKNNMSASTSGSNQNNTATTTNKILVAGNKIKYIRGDSHDDSGALKVKEASVAENIERYVGLGYRTGTSGVGIYVIHSTSTGQVSGGTDTGATENEGFVGLTGTLTVSAIWYE